MACFEATTQAIWLRNFVLELRVVDTISKPLRTYCDNTLAVFYSKNEKFSNKAKHVEVKYNFVKESANCKGTSSAH